MVSNDLDWLLRFSESNTLVQRYMRNPFLLNKKKACFKFTVLIKSIVPLQAYVLSKVNIVHAQNDFTMAQSKQGDVLTHVCNLHTMTGFEESVPSHSDVHSRAVDQIRAVLRAFQVHFGEEIKTSGELKSRAIYSCNI